MDSYNYKELRPFVFTEDGKAILEKIRIKIKEWLASSKTFIMNDVYGSGCGGDTWDMMTCVDYLVELKEIKEVQQEGEVWGQNRIFTSVK